MSNTSNTEDIERLVTALTEAHRSGVPASGGRLPVPATLAQAGRVQAAVAERLGGDVAGWKVGRTPDGRASVSAPLFRHLIVPDGGCHAWRGAAFRAVEIEIGFRLNETPSVSGRGDPLGDAFVGIEVVESRLLEGPEAPYLMFVADNIANGAYVVGPGRADWRSLDLRNLRCRVWRNGDIVHDAAGGHPQGDPLAPLRPVLASPIDRLNGLASGQIVTTGTLCGILRIDDACHIRAELEGFGEVSVNLQR